MRGRHDKQTACEARDVCLRLASGSSACSLDVSLFGRFRDDVARNRRDALWFFCPWISCLFRRYTRGNGAGKYVCPQLKRSAYRGEWYKEREGARNSAGAAHAWRSQEALSVYSPHIRANIYRLVIYIRVLPSGLPVVLFLIRIGAGGCRWVRDIEERLQQFRRAWCIGFNTIRLFDNFLDCF